jgi:hypothetical protein
MDKYKNNWKWLYDPKLLDNLALQFPEPLLRLVAVVTLGVDQITSELGSDAQRLDMVKKGSCAGMDRGARC